MEYPKESAWVSCNLQSGNDRKHVDKPFQGDWARCCPEMPQLPRFWMAISMWSLTGLSVERISKARRACGPARPCWYLFWLKGRTKA